MEKYNTSTFKNLLAGDLSDQETASLWQDPVFEQEFAFYLKMKQGGQQLIEKYTTVNIETDITKPQIQPLSPKLAIAASVVLALVGGYLLVPSGDTMMGNSPSFLQQYGLGLGLIGLGIGLGLFYFLKKK